MTMRSAALTHLRFDAEHTTLAADVMQEVALSVSVQGIVDGYLRHSPPTALEMERAIDAVEDALMSSNLQHTDRGELLTNEPLLQAWASIDTRLGQEVRLTLAEIEAIFQRLASASLGHPAALMDLPTERAAASAFLILRECMHHLGYERIRILTS